MMPLQLHLVAVRIGLLFAATQQSSPRECLLTPEGHEYRGHVNITMSGRTCQNWSSQKPHQHPKCVGQESTVNYCRNNISEHLVCVESRPWCYTTDANKRWEFCKIPLCNELETTTAPDLLDRNMMHMSGYRDDYNIYDVTDLNNATCQQVTATESNKAFRLMVELSNPVHSRLTVMAVLDEGDCLDFPATMVYTKGDQSVMRPYHNNPSFCDNTPGRCVFECDCSATSCQNVYLVILSAPDQACKLCEIFIV